MTVVQIISVISRVRVPECVYVRDADPFLTFQGGRDSVGYNIGSENPKS